jgi:hypothetical protein
LILIEKKNKIEDSKIQVRAIIKGLLEKIRAIDRVKREIEIQAKL